MIRLITSLISSVWMRRPSNAPGDDSRTWAFEDRYAGWHLRWLGWLVWFAGLMDSLLRELTLQTQEIKVVVAADQGIPDHWIQRVDNILPDRLPAHVLALLRVAI